MGAWGGAARREQHQNALLAMDPRHSGDLNALLRHGPMRAIPAADAAQRERSHEARGVRPARAACGRRGWLTGRPRVAQGTGDEHRARRGGGAAQRGLVRLESLRRVALNRPCRRPQDDGRLRLRGAADGWAGEDVRSERVRMNKWLWWSILTRQVNLA